LRRDSVDTEVVEHADDRAAQVVPALAVLLGDRADQPVEAALGLAGVERRERLGELRLALEADAGGQPVGGERARDVAEQLERLLVLAALVQDPRQCDGGVGAAGLELERVAQRLLVARGDEAVRLAREQRLEELLDLRGRLRADELAGQPTVLERLHGGDALDAERGRDVRVGVGVELGQRHLALALGHEPLEHRGQLAAGPAPRGPEVDDHRHLVRALDDVLLERRLCGVEDHTTRIASGP
jgi:hypothetical protein